MQNTLYKSENCCVLNLSGGRIVPKSIDIVLLNDVYTGIYQGVLHPFDQSEVWSLTIANFALCKRKFARFRCLWREEGVAETWPMLWLSLLSQI